MLHRCIDSKNEISWHEVTRQILLVVFLTCIVVAESAEETVVRLTPVATLQTQGCAGFAYFSVDNRHYLAAANFWDGTSHGMRGTSRIYEVTESTLGVESTPLILKVVQEFTTQGAHSWDYMEVPRGDVNRKRKKNSSRLFDAYLSVPNYYACGSERGPAKDSCRSTSVFRLSRQSVDEEHPVTFKTFQKLSTSGPAQTRHIVTDSGDVYLVVGENFNHELCLYRLVDEAEEEEEQNRPKRKRYFVKDQCLEVHGAGAAAVAYRNRNVYLIASSYHSGKTGWHTKTAVFVARNPSSGDSDHRLIFSHHQDIATQGCHDADYAEIHGIGYLFLAQDRNSKTAKINSTILTFNDHTERFETLQQIPTYGAHGGDVFRGPDDHVYVVAANFGDRLNKKYESTSSVWRQTRKAHNHSNTPRALDRVRRAPFELVGEISTHGATDVTAFRIGRRVFIAVANEGDIKNQKNQESVIYELSSRQKTE